MPCMPWAHKGRSPNKTPAPSRFRMPRPHLFYPGGRCARLMKSHPPVGRQHALNGKNWESKPIVKIRLEALQDLLENPWGPSIKLS
jgi:hypothetical protein